MEDATVMELVDVLKVIASTLGPTAAAIVTWLLYIRKTVTRLSDKVLERGDGQVAPMLRAYITREQVKDLLREREEEWRKALNINSEKQESKASNRFSTVMDKLTGLTDRIASGEASHQRIEQKIDHVKNELGKLEGRFNSRDSR